MSDCPEVVTLSPDSPGYPAQVAATYGKKAPVLHTCGNLALLGRPGIGFCGSRKASGKGLETAADCADQAAAVGYAVVSGNAAGVDFTAHRAALKAGGTTVLVLPEGISHFRIRKDLKDVWDWTRVLVISQFEPAASWQAFRAMTRNGLIISLSRAMIVIEAGTKGGTLEAGLSTLKAGKPLFVAYYQDMNEQAPGNAILLERGGMWLAKLKATGRANLRRVLEAVENPSEGESVNVSEPRQVSFL